MRTGTLVTFEDLLRVPESDCNKYELLEGEVLVSPPANFPHHQISSRIQNALQPHAMERGSFHIELGFRLGHDSWVQPDASFVTKEQEGKLDPGGFLLGAPELAIEVMSKSNTRKELEQKIRLLFQHGAEEVWVVYPKTRTIKAHRAGQATVSFTETLTTPLFPNLRLDVRALFE